ncbi:Fe-S cluster assembly ATPase SufC [Megamonas hypermegale]|uniref:Fe-S cluster assembly ATPase SufC n=1 Tax=Megamonas hypermegale TaxID=158847 RepID=UPI000B3A012D|nr:Fe-S cluster assembly ATPase SufC [Megamonas hypermegale]OUO38632.1 Fe-S cluster assembly ATPase SufC [Megamonas hypermegale]
MNNTLLTINNLTTSADDKTILRDLNLKINSGETHILMGPNGAGKSTLGNVILGNPQYTVDKGSIIWEDEDITTLRTDERAKKGMFMSFQSPIEIPGISISQFIRTAMEANSTQKIRFKDFRAKMNEAIKTLNINPNWINRELNVGFSGGERKKIEMLQLLMLQPKFAILDETDSGLDVDAVKTVSQGIEVFQKEDNHSLLIITHNSKILQYLDIDYVHIIVNGTIIKTGDASLIKLINEQGYEPFINSRQGD